MTPTSQKELNLAYYIRGACDGLFTIREVAERLHFSTRRVKYLKAAYRSIGDAAFIHGNKGRVPANKIPDDIRKKIVALKMTEPYREVNIAHFTEILWEQGISYTKSTIRNILTSAGIKSPKCHRPTNEKIPRPPRSGREAFGDLLHTDATPLDWLGGGNARLVSPCYSQEDIGRYIDECTSYLSKPVTNGFIHVNRTVYMNEAGTMIVKASNGKVIGSVIGNSFARTSEAVKWQAQFYDFFERNNWTYSEVSRNGVEIYIKNKVYALIINPLKRADSIGAMVLFIDDLNTLDV
jgi:transposase